MSKEYKIEFIKTLGFALGFMVFIWLGTIVVFSF